MAVAAPIRPETTQQHGFGHAGLAWTTGDSAAGCSALSLLGPGHEVLTVAGAQVSAETPDGRRHVATMVLLIGEPKRGPI